MKQLNTTQTITDVDLYTAGDFVNIKSPASPIVPIDSTISVTGSGGYAKRKLMLYVQCALGATVSWKVLVGIGTAYCEVASGSMISNGLSSAHVIIDVPEILVPKLGTVNFAVLMKSDNAADTARTISYWGFDPEFVDANNRVDVGLIGGEAPMSEEDISAVVKADLFGDEEVTTPTALATNFKDKVLQIWAALFGRVKRNGAVLEYYDEGDNLIFTRTVSSDKSLTGYEDVAAAIDEE